MPEPGFFVSRDNLSYDFDKQHSELKNHLVQEHAHETASVSYLNIRYEGETYIPATLFRAELSPLKTVVKYMRENLGKANKEIASALQRSPASTWSGYNQARRSPALTPAPTNINIPLSVFSKKTGHGSRDSGRQNGGQGKKLSILEAVVFYLKNQGMRFSEIAELIARDQRTVWTLNHRAESKLKPEPGIKAGQGRNRNAKNKPGQE